MAPLAAFSECESMESDVVFISKSSLTFPVIC